MTLSKSILFGLLPLLAGGLHAEPAVIAAAKDSYTNSPLYSCFVQDMLSEHFDWREEFFNDQHSFETARKSGTFLLIYCSDVEREQHFSTNECPTVGSALNKINADLAKNCHIRVVQRDCIIQNQDPAHPDEVLLNHFLTAKLSPGDVVVICPRTY